LAIGNENDSLCFGQTAARDSQRGVDLSPALLSAMINFLYTVTLFELFLGGGGRLIEVGPLTLRMILFGMLVTIGGAICFKRYRSGDGVLLALELVLAFFIVHLPALIMGDWRGADIADIVPEAQQPLYWLVAPVFAYVLQSPDMVRRTATVAKASGIILAITYILIVAGILTGKIDFGQLYRKLHDSGEIVARSETYLFYKGFLYLGIAIIFFVATRSKYWVVSSCLLGLALVMTLTRGFVLSTSLSLLLLLAVQRRTVALGIGVGVVFVAALFLLVLLPGDALISGRAISNVQRLDDMRYMLDHVSASTIFFGEGFGTLINGRASTENTFLWALWRMGIAGLVFWLMPLILCLYYFRRIPSRGSNGLACAYFFGVILVYLQTTTNPYLNNPIGLSFVIVGLFSLRSLAINSEREQSTVNWHKDGELAVAGAG
jgi:hypothetical protein